MEIILLLFIILVGYLWWTNKLPASPSSVIASLTNAKKPLEMDIKTFDKFYASHRNRINLGRLEREKSKECVILFNVMMDASNKGKRSIVYRDLPASAKMYAAFSTLVDDPDKFFGELSYLSNPPTRDVKVADYSNNNPETNNVGLHIENEPTKTNQYAPRVPNSAWRHIERTRGPH
jgi:hypothetical protein